MPPRIQTKLVTNSLLPCLNSSSASSVSSGSLLCASSPSATHSHQSSTRAFSSTPAPQTRLREQMFEWLNNDGRELKSHIPGVPNYLTNMKERRQNRLAQEAGDPEADTGVDLRPKPFPLNPAFISESILSEELRQEIYDRLAVKKHNIREVSVDLGVDMRRIAAVVRLVELENRWKKQGKPLAIPYARAVHEMVPVTKLAVERGAPQPPHESINDLPAHRLTEPQIFYPVSESRQFNRVDAGRVFSGAPLQNPEEAERITSDPGAATLRITQRPKTIERVGKGDEEHQVLQPADVRIPHPHLISYHRDRLAMPNEKHEWARRYQERIQKDEAARQERKQFAKAKEEKHTRKVQPENSRFEFRFSDVVVSKETTGADGRGHAAPGRRYGVPNYDRSKGQIKIPKRVDV